MSTLKLLKTNLDNLSYEQVLEHRFRDLTYTVNEWCGDITISCTFTMDKNVWDSYRKSRSLGHIYNTDLSNYLSRKGVINFYAIPSVDDRSRAKNGRKTIRVTFHKRS